jgi:hypothetical protein
MYVCMYVCMDFAVCHLPGAQHFEVAARVR